MLTGGIFWLMTDCPPEERCLSWLLDLLTASGDKNLILRVSVRAELLDQNTARRRFIADLASGVSWPELVARHAPDLWASPRIPWWKGSSAIGTVAGLALFVVLVVMIPGQHNTVAAPFVERLVAAALLIGRTLFVDPMYDAWRVAAVFLPVARRLIAVAQTGPGIAGLCVIAAGLAIQVAKAVRMNARLRVRPGELILFVGRKSPFSYPRPIKWVPISLLIAATAEQLGFPALVVFANVLAFGGIAEFSYRLVFWISRPVLLLTEQPGVPRQCRLEVFGGLLRIEHFAVTIDELRAASVSRSVWWVPTENIALRRVNGSIDILDGFVRAAAARDLVDEINRLVRQTPPVPVPLSPGGFSHHATHTPHH
jgi:hypothetical protein